MLSGKKNPHRSGPHSSHLCCATATYMIIFMYLTMYESFITTSIAERSAQLLVPPGVPGQSTLHPVTDIRD